MILKYMRIFFHKIPLAMFGEAFPIVSIDSGKSRKLDICIALQKLYYCPEGYYRTVNKLHEASEKVRYDFTLDEVRMWLEKQAVHQIHMPPPRYIPRVSFNSIQIPNECHVADVLYLPHDKIGNKIYKYCLCIVDVASRFKVAYPLTNINSTIVANALKQIYNSRKCPLKWPKLFLTDQGPEFRKDCEKLMRENDVKIQKAKSKRTMGIVERFNRTLAERLFRLQDASDLLLQLSERDRKWVKNLPIILKDINNSKTSLTGIAPVKAIKMKNVIAKPSYPAYRPIGKDEIPLPSNTEVRHLLESGELEIGKRRATDLYWSPEVFTIDSYLIQEGQPILYKLYNGPKRSFVVEELQIVPPDTELPPQWILHD